MKDEFIVKGAMATCQFGVAPAMLSNIMDNMNVYFNGKLAATSMSLGPVFQTPAFGTCNMVPNMPKPCAAVITKWDNVFMGGVKINRISSLLTKDSKGTCALGCPMCISFTTTGQLPIPAVPLPEIVKVEHQSDLNPLAGNDKAVDSVTQSDVIEPESIKNENQTNGYAEKQLRENYQKEANDIKERAKQMIVEMEESGTDPDDAEEYAARWANKRRNELKIKYLKKTPEDLRNLIFEYNVLRGKKSRFGTVSYNYLRLKKHAKPMDVIESAARPQAGPQVVANSMIETFNMEKEKAKTELELALEQEEINEATARLKKANKRIKKANEVLTKYNMLNHDICKL